MGCDFGTQTGSVTIAAASMEPQREFVLNRSSDATAHLGSNGTIQHRVRFAAEGTYEFILGASGTEAAGELPNIHVGLDGQPIADVPLEKADWHSLRLTASVPTGEHEVSLSFTNDYYDPLHHQMSKKQLHRYCNERSFMWDNRKVSDGEWRVAAIEGEEGKRLMYREPTA